MGIRVLFCYYRFKKKKKRKPEYQLFYRRKRKQAKILQDPSPPRPRLEGSHAGGAVPNPRDRAGCVQAKHTPWGPSASGAQRHPPECARCRTSGNRLRDPAAVAPCPPFCLPHSQRPVGNHGLKTVTWKIPEISNSQVVKRGPSWAA